MLHDGKNRLRGADGPAAAEKGAFGGEMRGHGGGQPLVLLEDSLGSVRARNNGDCHGRALHGPVQQVAEELKELQQLVGVVAQIVDNPAAFASAGTAALKSASLMRLRSR